MRGLQAFSCLPAAAAKKRSGNEEQSCGRYMFLGLPRLTTIDISNNPKLTELLPMTFDGAFLSGQVSNPQVVLGSSNFEVISKRAFNFDIFGIASTAAITIETGESNRGLRTCCGYDWLLADRHFATSALRCVNSDNQSVRLSSEDATLHCCVNASDRNAVDQLRSTAERPSSTSYLALTESEQEMITRLCVNAEWALSTESRLVRDCGDGCQEDTAISSVLQRALQPFADSCDGAPTTCPAGYGRSL